MPRVPADVPPTTVPKSPVAEVASYGATSMWVDAERGVLLREGSRTTRLPLSPKLRDLDLGPGPDGRALAVYVRCASGCNAYTFDLRRRREARVPGTSLAHLPTVWGAT